MKGCLRVCARFLSLPRDTQTPWNTLPDPPGWVTAHVCSGTAPAKFSSTACASRGVEQDSVAQRWGSVWKGSQKHTWEGNTCLWPAPVWLLPVCVPAARGAREHMVSSCSELGDTVSPGHAGQGSTGSAQPVLWPRGTLNKSAQVFGTTLHCATSALLFLTSWGSLGMFYICRTQCRPSQTESLLLAGNRNTDRGDAA